MYDVSLITKFDPDSNREYASGPNAFALIVHINEMGVEGADNKNQ